jgi:secretion/DNA translocation related TadE-like protein
MSGHQRHRGHRRPPAKADDGGSATIWSVGGIAALFLAATAVLAMGAVVQTRHRATAAADLAALAAATYAPDGPPAACDRARWVADHMRVRLTSCAVVGWDALVEVTGELPGALQRFGQVTEHSRAGPADP